MDGNKNNTGCNAPCEASEGFVKAPGDGGEHGRKARERRARRQAKLEEEARSQIAIDEGFMREAVKQARKAAALREVPIGCVIVQDGKVVARGYNRRNADHSALSHAEVTAIRRLCKKIGDWRLSDCTLYVTLEPCPMCAGAILQSRMGRVVIGADSPKSGSSGTVVDLLGTQELNHSTEVTRGVLAGDCSKLLTDFFKQLRAPGTA